jgi:uncharacterized protein
MRIMGFNSSMIDSSIVSSLIFHPRKVSKPKNLPDNIKILQFRIVDEVTIGGLFFKKSSEIPSVLYFHGNGEISTDYLNIYKLFFQINVNLAVVDYRGYGFSTGNPFYSSLFSDSLVIYDQFIRLLESQKMNTDFFVMGRSLGSVCASEIGSMRNQHKAIIFESGFASLFNVMTHLFNFQQISRDDLENWSNSKRMKKIIVPTLIIHGTRDNIIPYTEASLILNNLPSQIEKQLISIEGANHNDILMYNDIYFKALGEFIRKNL